MKIVQDLDSAVMVMHGVALWMRKKGLNVSEYWQPKNMNRDYLLKHAEPEEFYVAFEGGEPTASVILQDNERNQSWKSIDGDKPKKAFYIHWLCVARRFAGRGYSKIMIEFAATEARKRGFRLLRLDTDDGETKLCSIYESLGFKLMGTEQEENHRTAFFEKRIK